MVCEKLAGGPSRPRGSDSRGQSGGRVKPPRVPIDVALRELDGADVQELVENHVTARILFLVMFFGYIFVTTLWILSSCSL